jgi:hypothetical protein
MICPLLTVVSAGVDFFFFDYFRICMARVVAVNQLSMMLWHSRQSVENLCAG